MPVLNEVLVYRAYLLGILNRLIPKKITLIGAAIGWGAFITAALFCLLHGFWFDNNLSAHFDILALRNSFILGLIFVWFKERSNSLLMPVIAHGAEDLLFFLPRMV